MRPAIRALIAHQDHAGEPRLIILVSLELAALASAKGWTVLVDPEDQCALTRWEQQNRASNGK